MLISDVLGYKGGEVVTVLVSDKVRVAVGILANRRIGAVVVLEHSKPAGIFSERDLVNALGRTGPQVLELPVRDIMSSPIISGHSGDRIEAALQLMTRRRIRHLPILDGGALIGLVSIGDLVKHRFDEKEMEANVLLDMARMRA